MSKRVKKETKPAYNKTNNGQKFSTFRLIPAINQKNYFTHYLKKDSQFLCRKVRERPEIDDSKTCVFHIGSENLKFGYSDEEKPKILPFNIAKQQELYPSTESELEADEEDFDEGLDSCKQTFLARMKTYKIKVDKNAKKMCTDFNKIQKGTPVNTDASEFKIEDHKHEKLGNKLFCLKRSEVPENFELYWPFRRGTLNEDPKFYRSPLEISSDMQDILEFICKSEAGLNIKSFKDVSSYDAILVIPDMFDRQSLTMITDTMFKIGFSNVAIIEEAVAATYGSGVSSACVINVGAQNTSVTCVDEGMSISDSRVKLDYGSENVTNAFGRILKDIDFPGSPNFDCLDSLKQEFCTANENDISVQLYKYQNKKLKFDFKIYDEVILPILGLFEPKLLMPVQEVPWKNRLFPRNVDPYSGRISEPISDADINIRGNSLAYQGFGYERALEQQKQQAAAAAAESNTASTSANNNGDDANAQAEKDEIEDNDNENIANGGPGKPTDDENAQANAYESLDPKKTSCALPLHLSIIESIYEAQKHSGTANQYYTNLILVGGGSSVPNLGTLLTDFLTTEHHNNKTGIDEISVMPMPQDTKPDTLCWKGGALYSKLKVIDEMWTTSADWSTLGSRSLYYKASLYVY